MNHNFSYSQQHLEHIVNICNRCGIYEVYYNKTPGEKSYLGPMPFKEFLVWSPGEYKKPRRIYNLNCDEQMI